MNAPRGVLGDRPRFRSSFERPLLGLALTLTVALTVGLPAARLSGAPLVVYDDALRNGFADWSWGTHNLAQTSVVHSGTAAISFVPAVWSGLFFHCDDGFGPVTPSALEFWIHGGTSGGQNLTVAINIGGDPAGQAPLASFVEGGTIPAGRWAKVSVPFATLGLSSGTYDGFWLMDATGGTQPAIYVDDIQLLEGTPVPTGPVSVTVDLTADRHPISDLIYGVNFGSLAQHQRIGWPVRRWGGNSTTRYSWTDDTSNRASDWFYLNIPEENANPGQLPNGSSADRFIDETRASGGLVLLTVPTIGWTPKDRVKRWGFSVAKYGAQEQTECSASGYPDWCEPDAGNGLQTNGTPITGNDPTDTSRAITPAFVTDWMSHIASRTGSASEGGVRFFALDNEPALWNSTHRDVHPDPLTFDELWQRTRDYAAAIKGRDGAARVFGPVSWGWCEYFFSAADNCSYSGADFVAHGSVPLTQWLLRQVRDYRTAHGVLLLDYLDVHYYPQAQGVSLSTDESAATSARRLRSLKALYDPAYQDESWIPDAVRLIPRMKEWIASELPGTKLAITEYEWGSDDGLSSALAHAEALAIFGREGVDLATRWIAPVAGSRVEDAYRLYLDYDGNRCRVQGDSIRAISSDVDAVGAYAILGPTERLHILLFNKDTAARTANVSVSSALPGTGRLYRFDAATRLAPVGTVTPTGNTLSLSLPGRSATMATFDLPRSGHGLYVLTPCRIVDTRDPAGEFGGPALTAGLTRKFTAAGRCGIPSTARSLVLNLAVVDAAQAGSLRFFPAGLNPPPLSTALSFPSGRARANSALGPLAADGSGRFEVLPEGASGSLHLIVDVMGYFQ